MLCYSLLEKRGDCIKKYINWNLYSDGKLVVENNNIECEYEENNFIKSSVCCLFNPFIFVNSIPELQMQRLQDRCKHNKELLDKFINLWMPREEEYYNSYDFITNSDLIV